MSAAGDPSNAFGTGSAGGRTRADVAGQHGGHGLGARRDPEPQPLVVLERLLGHEALVIGVGIRMGHRRDGIGWE